MNLRIEGTTPVLWLCKDRGVDSFRVGDIVQELRGVVAVILQAKSRQGRHSWEALLDVELSVSRMIQFFSVWYLFFLCFVSTRLHFCWASLKFCFVARGETNCSEALATRGPCWRENSVNVALFSVVGISARPIVEAIA